MARFKERCLRLFRFHNKCAFLSLCHTPFGRLTILIALAIVISPSIIVVLTPTSLMATEPARKDAETNKTAAPQAKSQGPHLQGNANQTDPIHITADRLIADNNARTAEFMGNVTAVQGETHMSAERLKVYYGQTATGENGTAATENSIERIEAEGHVRITFDNRVAQAEKAVYTTNNRTLILKGEGSTVTSGQSVVTGSEIIYDRNKGQVNIRGGRNRVEAIIQSDQRGLN